MSDVKLADVYISLDILYNTLHSPPLLESGITERREESEEWEGVEGAQPSIGLSVV